MAQDGERRRAQRAVREQGALGKMLLQAMPFALPFPERLDLFRAWAKAEKCVYIQAMTRRFVDQLTDQPTNRTFITTGARCSRPTSRPSS